MTGLHFSDNTCRPANHARTAINNQAVDKQHVTDLPEQLPYPACTAGKHHLVKIIGVVFVDQHLVEGVEALPGVVGKIRILHIDIPGREHPGNGKIDRRTSKGMQYKTKWPVIVLGHMCQSRVFRADVNHALEEIAKDNRIDDITRHHGKESQCNQRAGYHPG